MYTEEQENTAPLFLYTKHRREKTLNESFSKQRKNSRQSENQQS